MPPPNFSNLRIDPINNVSYPDATIDPELYTIGPLPEFGNALYGFQLRYKVSPGSLTITQDTGGSSYQLVTSTPIAGQILVHYATGYCFCNVADNGKLAYCVYSSLGSNISIASLQEIADYSVTVSAYSVIVDLVNTAFAEAPLFGDGTPANPSVKVGDEENGLYSTTNSIGITANGLQHTYFEAGKPIMSIIVDDAATGTTLYNAYLPRAWVNFNGTGTVAINASGNVSSITDNGTGDYSINLITAMPDTNYCVIGNTVIESAEGDARTLAVNLNRTFSTSSFGVRTGTETTANDRTRVFVTVIR